MKANIRSICGAMLMLVIIPIIAGLLACMPVPIGDPERSRIDPQMSGWWVMEDGSSAVLSVLRPYDKRTWLVISVGVEKGRAAQLEIPGITTAGDLLAVLQKHDVGQEGIVGDAPTVYKAWLTRLGGKRFMTWEPVGQIEDTKKFLPDAWFVFSVEERSADHFDLIMLNVEYEGFEALVDESKEDETDPWKARKKWERAIKKNLDDPEMYTDEGFRFRRLPSELESKAARLVVWPFNY